MRKVQRMESRGAVIVALLANAAIAATKYLVAFVTGSPALLAEAIHSTVDTADQLLVLHGQSRSRKPPDATHPFGHGQELYFWTTIVAVLLFGLGGGVSFAEGLRHVLHPDPAGGPPATWGYVVLGVAAAFESASFVFGFRKLWQRRHGRSVWRTFREGKDPSILTVVGEDSAALLGIAVAFAGLFFSRTLRIPQLDGAAAMLIGCVQATAAVLLARESHSLLVGEAAEKPTVDRFREAMRADSAVEDVGGIWTMYFGPEQILVGVEIQFRRDLAAVELERAVDRIEDTIRRIEPRAKRIFVELQTIRRGERKERLPAAPRTVEAPAPS